MTFPIPATEPANASAVFRALIALLIAAVLGSMVWGALVGQQPSTPLARATARAVDSAWYQTLPMNPEAATNKYLERMSSVWRARSDAFGRGSNLATMLYVVRNVAAILLLMFSGAVARTQRIAERLSSSRYVQTILVLWVVFFVFWSLAFPLVMYQSWVLPWYAGPMYAEFYDGLSVLLMSGLLDGIVFIAVAATLYAIARGSIKRCLTILISSCAVWATFNVVIQPLKDRYVDDAVPVPASSDTKKNMIRAFAEANGVPANALWLQNVDEQDGNYGAATSGLGSAAHILMDDDMLQDLSDDELKYVLAHEFAHFKQHHVLLGLLFSIVVTSATFLLAAWVSQKFLVRFRERWRVSAHVLDVRALPLVYGVYLLIRIAEIPLDNVFDREYEATADAYALQITNRPDVMADYLVRGGEMAEVHPSPVAEFVFWDHPSIYNRVLAAMRWRARLQQ